MDPSGSSPQDAVDPPPAPLDVPAAVRAWLRVARHAYGDDQPLAAAGRLQAPPPPTAPEYDAPLAPTSAPERLDEWEEVVEHAPPPPLAGELPDDLDGLRRIVQPCRRCKLCDTRTQVVFGEGAAEADVLFVGEAPGAREDELGRPFVGPAGQLLTKIIEGGMGLRRSEVYIANVNKCRPPGNRNPEPDEVAACLPYLQAQIRAIRPRVLVALGRVAAHNLLGTDAPMSRLRGRELDYQGIPVVCTWHPAYLLRTPSAKRETWEDVKRVNRLLGRPEDPRAGT